MGLLSAGPMKSVKSLSDRRQEIEQQLHAIAMRQPPSQTVKSPDGHLVIHAPFDIQDLKKRVRLKSQLAQIDLKLGPAKPVKKSVPQRTPTITNGGSELLTEQLLAQRWFCSTSRLQRWRMDDEMTVRTLYCLRWRLPHRDSMQLLFNLLSSIDE